jgi:hypothetical protein
VRRTTAVVLTSSKIHFDGQWGNAISVYGLQRIARTTHWTDCGETMALLIQEHLHLVFWFTRERLQSHEFPDSRVEYPFIGTYLDSLSVFMPDGV